jgi:hypothetical protein
MGRISVAKKGMEGSQIKGIYERFSNAKGKMEVHYLQ